MSVTLTVTGMHCDGCESTVEAALEAVEGVTAARADRDDETTIVDGEADVDALVNAVEDVGYSASA